MFSVDQRDSWVAQLFYAVNFISLLACIVIRRQKMLIAQLTPHADETITRVPEDIPEANEKRPNQLYYSYKLMDWHEVTNLTHHGLEYKFCLQVHSYSALSTVDSMLSLAWRKGKQFKEPSHL
ncbi:hypothetical protein KIN20_027731 [Parelaphostrongylus tenuis]|uniref:Uncharacterized protein n=1 Tax=Parelaphostrongylus tenuis TaxID=148309 RepID=A0AAD5QZY0_PARTN|nr:hypothetical protein KIN20_027731 [Parelaphostrongylus tenuis]